MRTKAEARQVVLEALLEGPLTVEEVAERIGRHYTTAMRHLNRLQRDRYVAREPGLGREARFILPPLGVLKATRLCEADTDDEAVRSLARMAVRMGLTSSFREELRRLKLLEEAIHGFRVALENGLEEAERAMSRPRPNLL